jgi:hypothetical protein
MKEEQHKSAATSALYSPEQSPVQIYTDLLTSMTAGNSLEDACKALSLDVGTVRRDLLPSPAFRKQLEAFMAEQITYAATGIASLQEPALAALRMNLQGGGEDPRIARLAHRILRDLAGPARDLRKRPQKTIPSRSSRSRKK